MDPSSSLPSPPKLLIKLSNPYVDPPSSQHPDDQNNPSFSLDLSTTPKKKKKLSLSSSSSSQSVSCSLSSKIGNESFGDITKKSTGKRIYTKRTTEKIRRWTKEESQNYEKFIDKYADIFNDSSSKRVTKIFIFMAEFIGTKTPSQCRSHHQKFFRRIQKNKLLSSGKVTNEEEFEKLMPKKRKKKQKDSSLIPIEGEKEEETGRREEEGAIREEEEQRREDEIGKIGDEEKMEEEAGKKEEIGRSFGEFLENGGFGEEDGGILSKMNLESFKKNINSYRKISLDEKEYLNNFPVNPKTRRKSSISMLFNNNYFYQAEPEFPNTDYNFKPANEIGQPEIHYVPTSQANNWNYNYHHHPPPYSFYHQQIPLLINGGVVGGPIYQNGGQNGLHNPIGGGYNAITNNMLTTIPPTVTPPNNNYLYMNNGSYSGGNHHETEEEELGRAEEERVARDQEDIEKYFKVR